MPSACVIMRNGETLMGEVEDKDFTIQSENFGKLTFQQEQIAWILFHIYKGNKDQLMLQGQTQYDGKITNAAITVRVAGTNMRHDIPTERINALQFELSDSDVIGFQKVLAQIGSMISARAEREPGTVRLKIAPRLGGTNSSGKTANLSAVIDLIPGGPETQDTDADKLIEKPTLSA